MRTHMPLLAGLALAALAGAARAADPWPYVTPGAIVLRNEAGMEAHILRTGACVQRLVVPDANGERADVILGFDDAGYYRNNTSVSGCILGRVGNRINGANFALDGVTYLLDKNSGGRDTLHGGTTMAYHRQDWDLVAACQYGHHAWAMLRLFSPDLQQNFPGNVTTHVVYTLTADNELVIDIHATTDKATPINVMSHPYLNLKGFDQGTIAGHEYQLNADYYCPNSNTNEGNIVTVTGTDVDYRTPRAFGTASIPFVSQNFHSVLFGIGPNAKDVVKGFIGAEPAAWAATLFEPTTGRGLDILTTAPSFVTYTGLGSLTKGYGKNGYRWPQYGAVALEAVAFPNAINNLQNYPSPVLRPGEEYHNQVVWRFLTGRKLPPPEERNVPPVRNPTCISAHEAGECGNPQGVPSLRGRFLTAEAECKPCPAACTWCTNIVGVCKACRAGFSLVTKANGSVACRPDQRTAARRMAPGRRL